MNERNRHLCDEPEEHAVDPGAGDLPVAVRAPHVPHSSAPPSVDEPSVSTGANSLLDAVRKANADASPVLPTMIRMKKPEDPWQETPSSDRREHPEPGTTAARAALFNALRVPRVPRGTRVRRTRFINKDRAVVDARDRVIALIANLYVDADAVRKRLEDLVLAKGARSADVARRLASNPGAFAPNGWRGRGDENWQQEIPLPHDLADALDTLAGAVSAARSAAVRAFPVSSPAGGKRPQQEQRS